MALLVSDISGVLAVFAVIYRFEIILRKTGGDEKAAFAASENGEFFLEGIDSLLISAQKLPAVLNGEDGNRVIEFFELRKFFVDFLVACSLDIVILKLPLFILTHYRIVL